MPKDFFCKSLYIIQCILGNKIMAIILADICATRYSFIDEKFYKNSLLSSWNSTIMPDQIKTNTKI